MIFPLKNIVNFWAVNLLYLDRIARASIIVASVGISFFVVTSVDRLVYLFLLQLQRRGELGVLRSCCFKAVLAIIVVFRVRFLVILIDVFRVVVELENHGIVRCCWDTDFRCIIWFVNFVTPNSTCSAVDDVCETPNLAVVRFPGNGGK